jgi:hypothetical protein
MSIFRETFDPFVEEELKRRQDGMLSRNPSFIHQLNSRSAWVRMTSGVNVRNDRGEITNELAKNYVLQGGILNVNTVTAGDRVIDKFALKSGLGGASNSYSNKTPGNNTNRLGIRPMPGITNVSIQSKGAYGSLQEATVSFVCWDIKQLEDLEQLYMRPGYTVLFEMGWDYAKADGVLPQYDILNPAKTPLVLNEAFKEIYTLIEKSKGNYNALLGYVKNYNWSARDDGGYDCTTSIISLGEVLESLKCNWVPLNTKAFDLSNLGLLQLTDSAKIPESYKQGLIPGLLQEIYLSARKSSYANVKIKNYDIFKKEVGNKKNDRGGLPRYLGKSDSYEYYITLESFCNLLNEHLLLKDENDNPLVQLTTNEQTSNGEITSEPLKCIASPLSLSTNLGICYIENPNWESLEIPTEQEEQTIPDVFVPIDIQNAIISKNFTGGVSNVNNRFRNKITKTVRPGLSFTEAVTAAGFIPGTIVPNVSLARDLSTDKIIYKYNGNLKADLEKLAEDIRNSIIDVKLQNNNLVFVFKGGSSFTQLSNQTSIINLRNYFKGDNLQNLFFGPYTQEITNNVFKYNILDQNLSNIEKPLTDGQFVDNTNVEWDLNKFNKEFKSILENTSFNELLQNRLTQLLPQIANQISDEAIQAGTFEATKKFLVKSDINEKQLGVIGNIYLNMEYLYDKAISRNLASNDTQTKNVISIRDYLQEILRDVQNSIGNLNTFDLQVDDRNAIGRIIDISFTGNTNGKEPFTIQLHNLQSCVRDYEFKSQIFPEMGSIIAISAQDPEGIGTLGYDNATLVAWNDGIADRLIPKRLTTRNDSLSEQNQIATYVLPFLTQVWNYFKSINGEETKDDINLAYGGLTFAFRDFLSYVDKFDKRNKFKTIIPTELSIVLDGIGGIIIGNLFKINQDIVPKGYRNIPGRNLAYIVTRLSHNISDNDWTTRLNAYPIIFEQADGKNITKDWKNNQYPRGTVTISAGDRKIILGKSSISNFNQDNIKKAVRFFISKGFSDVQVAALVGGFIQESGMRPDITNSIGAIGIAQWLGDRKKSLLKKSNSNSLETQLNFVIEEFNSTEKAARNKLKQATTLEEAIAAAAAYERFGGINNGVRTTFQNVINARETGNRIEYSQELLNNINNYK